MINKAFEGIITKAAGGVYVVDALDGCLENGGNIENIGCAARGIFRIRGINPCVGDLVRVEPGENGSPVISEIRERRNFLVRPPLANLDIIVFVNSTTEPAINRYVLDKLIAIADSKGIEPVIVFTKIDLEQAGELPMIYSRIGIPVCEVDNTAENGGEGAQRLRALISGKISAFVGNSGVGKSSLLNVLYPELELDTSHISKKLGRGRHTTRSVQMYKKDGYIADTPGFSTVDTERYCRIPKGELDGAFREFREHLGECEFSDCAHVKERGCAVKAAVEKGLIAQSRYDSYLRMFEEASKINEWDK